MVFFLASIFALMYKINNNDSFYISKGVNEDQLIQGYFQFSDFENIKYNIRIYGEDRSTYYNTIVENSEKVNFSFSNMKKQNIEVEILITQSNKRLNIQPGYVDFYIKNDRDYFNEKIATKEFREPILKLLLKYTNILNRANKQHEELEEEIEQLKNRFNLSFSIVFIFSIIVFVLFVGINYIQCRSVLSYFKKKKML